MAKVGKAQKVPNAILYSRVSYLHQAAIYLATQKPQLNPRPSNNVEISNSEATKTHGEKDQSDNDSRPLFQANARLLVSDLREVAEKVVIRMAPSMKHSICRNCDTILLDGTTCSVEVENKSKGGKKSWADVLVRQCRACGHTKRIPMGERQKPRSRRVGSPNTEGSHHIRTQAEAEYDQK